jgi:hypothetical protein
MTSSIAIRRRTRTRTRTTTETTTTITPMALMKPILDSGSLGAERKHLFQMQ